MYQIVIGVDIAKLKFDVASLNNGKYKHKVFTNNEQGYPQFINWIQSLFSDVKPLICMEATGAYSLPLAEFMVNQGYAVSVVNPAKIKAFANSELSRTKTDKADAKLIARYAITLQPALWTPPPENIRILQALTRRVNQSRYLIKDTSNKASFCFCNAGKNLLRLKQLRFFIVKFTYVFPYFNKARVAF